MQRTNNKQNRPMKKKKIQVQAVQKPRARTEMRARGSFAPAAFATPQLVKEPRISMSKAGTVISHREFLGDVTGSVSFDVDKSLDINPGLAATFPWLSTQASGWEQYRFRKLDFELVTRAPTTATGGVYIAPDYDVLDSDPTSELQISTYRDTVEDACWKDQTCRLDPSAMFPMGPRKFVRDGLVSSGDLKSYDAGRLYVATVGQADTSAIGKLWANYVIEFFVPQTGNSTAPAVRDFAQFNQTSNQTLANGVAELINFPGTVTNAIGVSSDGAGNFTLPKGNWLVTARVAMHGGTSAAQEIALEVLKNGLSLSPKALSLNDIVAAGAGTIMSADVSRYVFSNGTDIVSINAVFSSVAGTLVAAQDECRIQFQLL